MNTAVTKKQGTIAETFSDKCLTPLFWATIAYAFGFFHGYSRKRKKAE